MRAMVLAAGLGTRLRPLTNDCPKALVEVASRTLLDITLSRLRRFGINDVIINAHHCADMLSDYLDANQNFGMNIDVSREDVLLDTGGGLKKAAHFFADSNEPFLLHNVDVLSNIDFRAMLQLHLEQSALATLAVQQRASSRQLLFDGTGQLCGRRIKDSPDDLVRPAMQMTPLAFSGIHIISPRIFTLIQEAGVFSIVDVYLRLAKEGEKIVAIRPDEYYWRDLGTLESLRAAEEDVQKGLIAI
ncbi:MAG: nucleotidyltransferase family protein [Candidatus Korobacteraceae bacterium]